MSMKILCVDDDANILAAYQRNLRKKFTLDVAYDGPSGLEMMEKQGPYAVLVADMQMPGMKGIELLALVRERFPDTVRLMLTGNADQQTAVEAVNQGQVFRFLNKPCSPEMLAMALDAALLQYRLVQSERELLAQTLQGSIHILSDILCAQDAANFGRSNRLRQHLQVYLQSFPREDAWQLEIAFGISQIGMVTVPATVVQKQRQNLPLSLEEQSLLHRVPEIGAELLRQIPRMEPVAEIIRWQNCLYETAQRPDHPVGEKIPFGARLLKLLSDLEELERRDFTIHRVFDYLRQRQGWYDPALLDQAMRACDVTLPPADELGTLQLPVRQLRPGLILASDVVTVNGLLIIGAGSAISQMMVEKIWNFHRLIGIQEPILVKHGSARD